jgi:hypothetical protein
MLYIGIPLLVCVLGFIIWLAANGGTPNGAVIKEAGKWGFVIGLLVSVLVVAFKYVKLS